MMSNVMFPIHPQLQHFMKTYLTFQTCAFTIPPTVQVISTTSSREFSGFLLHRKEPSTTVPAETIGDKVSSANHPVF